MSLADYLPAKAAHDIVWAPGAVMLVDGDSADDGWFHRRLAFAARYDAMGAMFDAIDWRWPRG